MRRQEPLQGALVRTKDSPRDLTPRRRGGVARSSSCILCACLLCAWAVLCIHAVWRIRNRATVVDPRATQHATSPALEPRLRYPVVLNQLQALNLFGVEVSLRTEATRSSDCAVWADANLSTIQTAWQSRWLSPSGIRAQDGHLVSADTDQLLRCCHLHSLGSSGESASSRVVSQGLDVVYTFVNGSAPSFLQRWGRAAARAVPTSSSTDTFGNGNSSALRERLRVSAAFREHFQERRYRDLGELQHSLLSLANCLAPFGRRTPRDFQSSANMIPLSGVVHVVVGHRWEDRPWFLDDDAFRQQVAQRIGRNDSALDIRIVTHSDLVIHADGGGEVVVSGDNSTLSDPDGELFNSNAIETLLHRIPGLSETFFYFNNDMLWGRCPDWVDYFVPVAMRNSSAHRVILQLAPLVFGETQQQQQQQHQTTAAPPQGSERPLRSAPLAPTFARPRFVSGNGGSIASPTCEPRNTCLRPSDGAQRDDPRDLNPTESFSFAHLPRLMTKRTLRFLLEHTPELAPVVQATRANRIARSHSDLWVPLTVDWFVWDAARMLIPDVAGVISPCVCSPSDARCTVPNPDQRRKGCIAIAIRGHPDYAFYMVDSAYRARKFAQEIRTRATRPLFITVNDDAAPSGASYAHSVAHHRRRISTPSADSLQTAADTLLSALAHHNDNASHHNT